MNRYKIPNGGQKMTLLGGPKGKKGKKGLSKGNDGFHQKGGHRPYQPDKGAGKDFPKNKGRGKDQKRKGKEGTFPQSGFSASETPNEVGYGQGLGIRRLVCPVTELMVPGLQMLGGSAQKLILHGWWQLR